MTTEPDETEDRPRPDRVYEDDRSLPGGAQAPASERGEESRLFDGMQRLAGAGNGGPRALAVRRGARSGFKGALETLVENLTRLGLRCSMDDQALCLCSDAYPEMWDA